MSSNNINGSHYHRPYHPKCIRLMECNPNDDSSICSSDSDEESMKTVRRTVPSIVNIVMGRAKTVEFDDEHEEENIIHHRKRQFPCFVFIAVCGNGGYAFGSRHFTNPCRNRNISCNPLDFVVTRCRWFISIANNVKRCFLLVGYALLIIMVLRIEGRTRVNHNLQNQLQAEASQRGTFFSSWGGKFTYYGKTKDLSMTDLNTEFIDNKPFGRPPPQGIVLPESLENLADIGGEWRAGDVPLFWHIPRSAGSTVKDVMGYCLGMVEASDAMGGEFIAEVDSLHVIKKDGAEFLNVDTSTLSGIERAKSLQVASSNLTDVVVSILFQDIATMFTPSNQGRLFTVIRHPVERAVSVFYYISYATSGKIYSPEFSGMSLEEYARNPRIENNWMTRFLTGVGGELNENHLNMAKEIIRCKCLVGLLEDKQETFKRFKQYLNWNFMEYNSRDCVNKLIWESWPNHNDHPPVHEESEVWRMLLLRNSFDVDLYEYAKIVFKEQGMLFL